MEKELERLNKEKEKIEKAIKKVRWEGHSKKIFEQGKESIGNCYKFRNSWSGSPKSWYIYAEVVDCLEIDGSVYAVVNSYEKQEDGGEIIMRFEHQDLQATGWFHCWDWISKEIFLENKNKILAESMLKIYA